MKTTYVTLKQAEQLKKLKFDGDDLIKEGTDIAYDKNGKQVNWTTKHFHCWKPSLEYACRFLREDYDVHVCPHTAYNAYGVIYMCTVFFIHKNKVNNILMKDEPITIDYTPPQIFDTYELAQSAGFDYAVKLIREKKIKFMTEKDKEKRRKKIEKVKKEHQKVLDKSLENTKKLFNNKNKK